MERLSEAEVTPLGVSGDRCAKPESRSQVLLFDGEIAEALRIRAGDVRENFTLSGASVQGMPAGTRLRIGAAMIEVTEPCAPCKQMEKVRPGLMKELVGRRGMYAIVVEPGRVREGDEVTVDA